MSTKVKPQANPPSKKANQQKRKVVQKVSKPNGKLGLAYHVPPCVRHYLEASINPFDTPEGACLPADLFPLPSQKQVLWSKGTMATGTTGFGFITVYPTFSNNTSPVVYTQSTSVGVATTAFNAYTNTATNNFGNGPWATAQFTGQNLYARTVAVGLRVRCTASMMNRGGSYITWEQPNHADISVLYTYNSVKTVSGAQTHGIPNLDDPDQWDVSVCSSGPCITEELAYAASATPLGAVGAYLICAISSAVAGMTFDYEVYHHVEYNGYLPTKTPSHSSPQGFSSAVAAMKDQATIKPIAVKEGPSILQSFVDVIKSEMPHLIEMGTGIGQMLLGNEGSGLVNVLDGGYNIIADAVQPKAIMGQRLTPLQESILAPEAPTIRELVDVPRHNH